MWTYALLSPPIQILLAYRAILAFRRRRAADRRIRVRSAGGKAAFAGVDIDITRHVSIDSGTDGFEYEPLDHLVGCLRPTALIM